MIDSELPLIDVFMPEDLCARCAEEEPADDISVIVEGRDQRLRLFFCTEACKSLFVRGYQATKTLPNV